jgi:hypothetical protein
MKTAIGAFLLLLLAASATLGQSQNRFDIERHSFTTAVWPAKGDTEAKPVITTNDATFKLNTARGTVWRLESNRFVRIEGPDLGGDRDHMAWKNQRLMGRLDAVILPELNFRTEAFTNVLLILEQKIREQEPAFRMGPEHFLVWTNLYGDIPEITFSAKSITARQAMTIIASVCGLSLAPRRDVVYFSEDAGYQGSVEHVWYEVSPELKDLLRNDSVTNVLEELGMRRLPQGCTYSYLTESGRLLVAHTNRGHRELRELLSEKLLITLQAGRFRLQPVPAAEGPALWLIDQKTGESWLYRSHLSPNGRWEKFNYVSDDDQ